MNNWKELYEKYLALSKEELLAVTSSASAELLGLISVATRNSEEAFIVFLSLVSTFVAADKKVSEEEYNLFVDMTGFKEEVSFEDFKKIMLNLTNKEVVEACDGILDNLPITYKLLALTVGLGFCVSDGKVTKAEERLLELYAK